LPYIYRPQSSAYPLEHYLDAILQKGLRPNGFALLSAHQMSSCRMAGSARLGAVKPNGETYEVKNLYVADASVLPTASGVNPMLTIMTMAHWIAQGLKT
jgi:choline dehydrogenase-like flavoprotein